MSYIDVYFYIILIVNFCEDCPVIDRLYDYCLSYSSGTVGNILYSIIL